jgi:hypothetical protein
MAISPAKAKALCTASELSLVTASSKQQVMLLSMPQLRQKVERARKLRDKWRDQAAKQRRAAQAKHGARQASGNKRSAEKAELFAEVLARFEAEVAMPKRDRSDAIRARKASTLKLKKTTHSTDRAEIRKSLRQVRRKLTSTDKPAESPKAKVAPSSAAEAVSIQLPARTKPKTSKKRKIARSAKLAVAARSAPPASAGLQVSKRQQARAATRVKQTRLQAAGIVRIQKHVSAQNKRRQASRDAR